MVRVFTRCSEDQRSISGQVIPKTQKMILDVSLLNTQNRKVRIKDKWSNPEKGVATSSTNCCCSYWKGGLWVTLDYSWPIYNIYIYIYIYVHTYIYILREREREREGELLLKFNPRSIFNQQNFYSDSCTTMQNHIYMFFFPHLTNKLTTDKSATLQIYELNSSALGIIWLKIHF